MSAVNYQNLNASGFFGSAFLKLTKTETFKDVADVEPKIIWSLQSAAL